MSAEESPAPPDEQALEPRPAIKKNPLGRGLSALFGEAGEGEAALGQLRQSKSVPTEHLHPGRYQTRRSFDQKELDGLVESIRGKGVLQPVLVRQHPDIATEYEIIAGERRWRAAQQAQLYEIPVTIRDFSDRDALEVALIENIHRQDLTALEEAEGYQRLMSEFAHTQEDLARAVGRSRSHVANTLRLNNLPDPIKEMLQSRALSAGHARALITATDPVGLARKAVKRGLSVRQVERLAAKAEKAGGEARAPTEKDADTQALERDLSELFGLKVTINYHDAKGGTLVIHYRTLEQLDDVLQRLTAKPDNS